jgi:hypothetical protein
MNTTRLYRLDSADGEWARRSISENHDILPLYLPARLEINIRRFWFLR